MKITHFSQFTAAALLAFGISVEAQTLTMNQLPTAVQNVVRTETKNGPVNNIQQITRNGQPVYQIGLKAANGEKLIYLKPDGSYYQDNGVPTGTALLASTNAPAVGRPTRDVTLAQLPAPVRNIIKTEESNGTVQRIQQIPYNGREVYKVTLQNTTGAKKLVYLNQDGSYVHDQRISAVGAPAGGTTATRRSLSGATKVSFNQLPVVVQNTVKAYSGAAPVEDVDKGTLQGKTVYEAAFKQNGSTVELRVDEQGNIVKDAQDTAITTPAQIRNQIAK